MNQPATRRPRGSRLNGVPGKARLGPMLGPSSVPTQLKALMANREQAVQP